jgi:hypothetical protein
VAALINTYTTPSWIGDDIFRYRHGLAQDAADTSIWAMQFFTVSEYVAVVKGRSFEEAIQNETQNGVAFLICRMWMANGLDR